MFTTIIIKCGTQWDGLAKGALLAVILANLWIKSFEKSLKKPNEGRENKIPDMKGICFDCKRSVIFARKESSANHAKTGFMQNAKVSLTRKIGTCRKLYGSFPIVRKQ